MKTITIKQGCLGRYNDVSPFLVEDGTLALHFVLPRVSGEFYLVTKNASEKVAKIPATGDVELSELQAGELHAEVKHYLRGELIETFPVEPLIIKNVDGSVRAFSEIEELRGQIKAVTESVKALKEEEQESEKALKTTIHDLQAAFLAYAYAEYQNDIQLNGKSLSFAQFVAALGYDNEQFSEEEIKKIKAFKEEL